MAGADTMKIPGGSDDAHAAMPVLAAGARPEVARLAIILVHGRGGSAEDMLGLAGSLDLEDVAWIAPQAAGNTWYPHTFLSPLEKNEPWLGSALRKIDGIRTSLEERGIGRERLGLIGFSQGACLALEYAARHAGRYAGIGGLSGGLIGAEGAPRDYPGSFDGTPVLLGVSDIDPHIPVARVEESATVFTRMGAAVDARIYPGMGHTVNPDEIRALRAIFSSRG